jgi:predicted nucleic acid-binding protein
VRKPKLYLDTSVISHLDADDTPEKMEDTLRFWEMLKTNKFHVIISNVTLTELNKCTTMTTNELVISSNFTIDDIHKIRYDNYERTKHMTNQERIEHTRREAQPILERLEKMKAEKVRETV